MAARIRFRDTGGTLRTAARIRVRDDTNVLRTISRIRIRDVGNVLRTVWEAFKVVGSPSTVSGYSNTGAAASITTASTIALPSGGEAPFTYAWAAVDAGAYVWTINSPTAATTSFTVTALGAGATANALFQITVTDATGATAVGFVEAIANNGQPYEPPNRYQNVSTL